MYQIKKVIDVSKNVTDGVHSTVIDDKTGKSYLLSCKNIKNGKICYNQSDRRINQDTLSNLRKRSKLEYDDILLTSVGTIGEVARVNIKDPNYEFQRSVGLIKPNSSIVISKYLLYALQSDFSQNSIKSSIKGGVQPCLFIDDIKNIEIKLYDLSTQQHIVDSIGSVDDAIEKNEEIVEKIYNFLSNKFNELTYNKESVSLGDLEYVRIVKSGIDEFEGNKIYIDTSSVTNKSIIDTSYNITYDDRPSRANMQPMPNTVWFAKLKDSPKYIIVKNSSKRVLNNYVFSTGFMGLEADEYIINYLYLLILSGNFNSQKDASSTGATMMGINNDILYSIKVPNITKDEACSFGKDIDNFIETIISLQEKKYILKSIKKNLLSKYFD